MIGIVQRYFTFLRLKREFKKTHKQVYTVHENMKGEQWVTCRWELK